MNAQLKEDLLAKALNSDLTPEESELFIAACQSDGALRRRLARLVQVERMAGIALESDDESFAKEFRFRVEANSGSEFSAKVVGRLKKRKALNFVVGWAAVAAVVILALFLTMSPKQEVIAEIVRMEASDLSDEDLTLGVGERVVFDEGLVELYFKTGVSIILEAPADFEVTGENQGFLHRGKLVAEVDDETAHGFVIDGPSGRLVDLGTSFAVAVDDGGEMEVHVIDGLVDATVNGGETLRLKKDEAMRLSDGRGVSIKADVGKFVVRMPDYQGETPRYVRWGFDVRSDARVVDTGRGLGDGGADGNLMSYSGKGEGPKRVSGRFGKGIEFDGEDSFFTTDFSGIAGSRPRTVAFWIKVPKDFRERQGYGIINWGDVTVPGGAWQISINGTKADGPLGRLRIGTHWGQVIGTQDLRDGKWHHCAVVMYGAESGKPNTSTHILLYVDGELEPAARKSVQVIETVNPKLGRSLENGIWMGRNLGFEHEESPSVTLYGKFFRGSIDEMVICDMALNQLQILRLMRENLLDE